MIETDFDIAFTANLALREKQIQQNYRPVIAVHKWFARRPGTLFRSLILSEFVDRRVDEAFYLPNDLQELHIGDPFMGGGTPLLEANRMGCSITGYDINPMAYWVVREEIERLDIEAYLVAARGLREHLDKEIGYLYHTRCVHCASEEAHVKYFLWVKVHQCTSCLSVNDLFPGYLIAEARRHPRNVFVCASCGSLNETDAPDRPGNCATCGNPIRLSGAVQRGRFTCPNCGETERVPNTSQPPPRHRLFALEYSCTACRDSHQGRYFKKPDADDLGRYSKAEDKIARLRTSFVPDDEIPPGDETNRLHRWGYRQYRQMFNARQLLGLELSARLVSKQPDERIRKALATNLSDLLRYQNMLCRYDTMALKSLDIFSVHGYPVGLIQCESNMLGIIGAGTKTSVGSGGWSNIIEKFAKAKSYCDHPFEIRHNGHHKDVVPIRGEWIGEARNGSVRPGKRIVNINCADATGTRMSPGTFDAILTDPPYFGNVQYAELMDFCYVWLRKLVHSETPCFSSPSTRNPGELTGNTSMGRDLAHFTEGLSTVFGNMAGALKPGGPFVFTYHHNVLEAYYAVATAVLDAGLVCSATLPCPAEMGASIHISGTGSSIVDTVFVCRSTGKVPKKWICDTMDGIVRIVEDDAKALAKTYKVTLGDVRCLLFGHLVRLAIWHLRGSWKKSEPTNAKLAAVANRVRSFGDPMVMEQHLKAFLAGARKPDGPLFEVHETSEIYAGGDAFVPF